MYNAVQSKKKMIVPSILASIGISLTSLIDETAAHEVAKRIFPGKAYKNHPGDTASKGGKNGKTTETAGTDWCESYCGSLEYLDLLQTHSFY